MFRITRAPIALDRLTRAVRDPAAGAIVTFVGTDRVREHAMSGLFEQRPDARSASVGLRRPRVAHRDDRARHGTARLRVVLVRAHVTSRSCWRRACRSAGRRTRASRRRAAPGVVACAPASPGGSADSEAGSPRATRSPRAVDGVAAAPRGLPKLFPYLFYPAFISAGKEGKRRGLADHRPVSAHCSARAET